MKFNKLKPYLFCIASGFACALSFYSGSLYFLCFFSLIPVFLVFLNNEYSFRTVITCLMIFSLSYYLPMLLWLWQLYPLTHFGLSDFGSFLFLCFGNLFIAAVQSLLMSIAFLPFKQLAGGRLCSVIVFSFLYILGEAIQERAGLFAFPWARLGVIPYGNSEFIQSASLLGSLFLSLIVLIINGLLALSIILIRKVPTASAVYALAAAAILGANLLFGAARLSGAEDLRPATEVLIVQGNLSSIIKWNTSLEETLDIYTGLSQQNLTENTRIVVWPETAVPAVLEENKKAMDTLMSFTRENNVYLITGVFSKEAVDTGYISYNSMCIINPDGELSQLYHKRKLVPMGELIPFEAGLRKFFPILMSEIPEGISAGKQAYIIPTELGTVGGLICYESIFPIIARDTVKKGAQIITIISNDSWFGESSAIAQHHAHAVIRAVESGRYVMRAGNTGISSIIDNYGRVEVSAVPFVGAALRGKVKFISYNTLYTNLGDIILLPSIVLVLYAAYQRLKLIKIKK